MFTIIIFWQEKELKKEYEWILKSHNKEVEVLFLGKADSPDIENLIQNIFHIVNAREQWRIFFIDNYNYQCVHYGHNLLVDTCWCCNGCKKKNPPQGNSGGCGEVYCGMGRNPFTNLKNITEPMIQKHREELIQILNALVNNRKTEYVQPKDIFVLAVRDGEFICKQRDRIPNFTTKYWKIDDCLPKQCRYIVYDIKQLRKQILKKEQFWFYCMLSVLTSSEVRTEQFKESMVYRLDVNYKEPYYYVFLYRLKEEVRKDIDILNMKREQYELETRQNPSFLLDYFVKLKSTKVDLPLNINEALKHKNSIQLKRDIDVKIKEIFKLDLEEYKGEWERLIGQVSLEKGENSQIYEEQKAKYEKALLRNDFSKNIETVDCNGEPVEIKNIVKNLEILWNKYEQCCKNRPRVIHCIIGVLGLVILPIFIEFLYDESLAIYDVMQNKQIIIMYIIIAIITFAIYWGIDYWAVKRYTIWKIDDSIRKLEKYQNNLKKKREDFLDSTRDTMFYWKRKHNYEKRKEELANIKQKIDKERDALESVECELESLWQMVEGTTEQIRIDEKKLEDRKEIEVGANRCKTEYIFIKYIRFLRNEEERGKNGS